MRETDITVEYLTKKLRAYSKEDIISALVETDYITADRVASYCEGKKLMREAEAERRRIDDVHKKIIEYNPLYDKGFTRVGCIGCPMAGKHRQEEIKDYPKYKALYKKLADEIEKTMPNDSWKNNSEKSYSTFFDWWINV